jgi:hypothetical protein
MQAQMHRRDFDQCLMPVSDPDESGQGRGTGTPQRMEETSMQTTNNSDLIFSYTIDQATSDGILFDIRKVNPEWERGIFSHVTMNLLSLGYLNADRSVNLPNLLDFPIGGFSPTVGSLARGLKPPSFRRFPFSRRSRALNPPTFSRWSFSC